MIYLARNEIHPKRYACATVVLIDSCFHVSVSFLKFSVIGCVPSPVFQKDPLRIFYETLYEQIPTSEMSQIW